MLQELAARSEAAAWAIAAMFFFLAIWVGITVWVFRTRPEELEARARLPLEGDEDTGPESSGFRRSRGGRRDCRSAGPSGLAD